MWKQTYQSLKRNKLKNCIEDRWVRRRDERRTGCGFLPHTPSLKGGPLGAPRGCWPGGVLGAPVGTATNFFFFFLHRGVTVVVAAAAAAFARVRCMWTLSPYCPLPWAAATDSTGRDSGPPGQVRYLQGMSKMREVTVEVVPALCSAAGV